METTPQNLQAPQATKVTDARRKQVEKVRHARKESRVMLLEESRAKASRAATTPPITPELEKLAEEERKSLENERPVTLEQARAQVAWHHMT